MPEAPAIFQAAYYRRLAAVEERHPWSAGTRRVAGAIIPVLLGRPSGGLRILDVGCGTGTTLRWLRRFAGASAGGGHGPRPGSPPVRTARGGAGHPGKRGVPPIPERAVRPSLLRGCHPAPARPGAHPGRTGSSRGCSGQVGVVLLRANRATGAPEAARPGYPAFDYRTVPAELEEAGLTPGAGGGRWRCSLAWLRAGDAVPVGGWQHQGLALRPLTGLARPLGWVIGLSFWLEALAFRLRRRLPARGGASSLVAALKVVPFERA
ncbi:MAG: hypothetical protein KatS3mg061_1788 [Dehalococcoidia bacterium]|nr:MAG: hypothetical protein KatS3mg061_1788 [Dehalococcoidia bacterium]